MTRTGESGGSRSPRASRLSTVLALTLAAWCSHGAPAVDRLERGMDAPPVELPDLHGEVVRTSDLRGRTVVLVFGELYHERTRAACRDLRADFESPSLADRNVTPLLIVTEKKPDEALRADAADADVPWRVLRDRHRQACGTYEIDVLPTIVVIDHDGHVVHAQAGYLGQARDLVTNAVKVSEGLLENVRPGRPADVDDERIRATRLTNLARELRRSGLPELAEEKYREALEASPEYAPARLGIGLLYLSQQRLAEAESEFGAVLEVEPNNLDARLGRAYVQILRGEELPEVERALKQVLAAHPAEPRAHYLMGRLHQQRNEVEEAAVRFRQAVEYLMSQRGTWQVPTEEGAE